MNGLKKRLDDVKGKWVDELPHVLWTYRTTPHNWVSQIGIPLQHIRRGMDKSRLSIRS